MQIKRLRYLIQRFLHLTDRIMLNVWNRDAIRVWLKIDYVMTDCAVSMQLYSHGLVKSLRRNGLRKRNATTFPRSC